MNVTVASVCEFFETVTTTSLQPAVKLGQSEIDEFVIATLREKSLKPDTGFSAL